MFFCVSGGSGVVAVVSMCGWIAPCVCSMFFTCLIDCVAHVQCFGFCVLLCVLCVLYLCCICMCCFRVFVLYLLCVLGFGCSLATVIANAHWVLMCFVFCVLVVVVVDVHVFCMQCTLVVTRHARCHVCSHCQHMHARCHARCHMQCTASMFFMP